MLRAFHGSNTVPDLDPGSPDPGSLDPGSLDAEAALERLAVLRSPGEPDSPLSPGSPAPGSPAPGSSAPGSLGPSRRLTREDSISLLRRLNNWNTASPPSSPGLGSPRSQKLLDVNGRYGAEGKGRGEGLGTERGMDKGEAVPDSPGPGPGPGPRQSQAGTPPPRSSARNSARNSAGSSPGIHFSASASSTVYYESPPPSSPGRTGSGRPSLERRDSVTLARTHKNSNTAFGLAADSPRWRKVALLNKQRAAREEAREEARRAGGGKEAGEAESGEAESGGPGVFFSPSAAPDRKLPGGASGRASGRRGQLPNYDEAKHGPLDGENEAVPSPLAKPARERMDSIQLHHETGGKNTEPSSIREARNKIDSVTLAMDYGGRNTVEGSGVATLAASPRVARVRQLNRERRRKQHSRDDSGLGDESKEERKAGGGGRKERRSAPPSTVFFDDVDFDDVEFA
ncbi:hypothetical protein TeGR_g4531 [Tetraparma gracilis]|uniref:Uncharacterized protein n=1 Tax=Tetraparma gracilis TaxID=2962635 RepID=A0ABQ6N9D5_9STRA|nr:hypothetical protein TeGR_g4531 [Tetraparma gracilis]